MRAWLARSKRPLAVDLFSGAGGLSLGLQAAGFRVVAAADHDPVALETHAANVGGITYPGNLADPSGLVSLLSDFGIDRVDLVAGGPPCQPFSRAGQPKIRDLVRNGQRSGDDGRVELWRSFCQVVDELSPRAVLFENVPDLTRWNGGEVLLQILQALQERRFCTHARVLTASNFGVPQPRARLFIVGLRSGEFRWPNKRDRVTLGDAISDLPSIPAGHRDRVAPYDHPRTPFQKRARRDLKVGDDSVVFDHVSRDVRKDDAEAFELLGPGDTYKKLPKRLQRYRSDIFTDKYKRLDEADVCRTITAHIARDGYWYIHPSQTRTLSVREAARVQTFPDWFRFAGHTMAQYRQIGNAVPPELARAVARRVYVALQRANGTEERRGPGLVDELLAWWEQNRRPFPWRSTKDPWEVLLAELCLRRTRAQQVADRFGEAVRAAPSPRAALRNESGVREALKGLGLNRRAQSVLDVARVLADEHDGRVPEDDILLRSLPGVGHYIAGAVRCFAFGKPTVLVDTNTSRIAERVVGRSGMAIRDTRLEIFRLTGLEGPTERVNLAFLDLGGLVCSARAPRCDSCPIRRHCAHGRRRANRRLPQATEKESR